MIKGRGKRGRQKLRGGNGAVTKDLRDKGQPRNRKVEKENERRKFRPHLTGKNAKTKKKKEFNIIRIVDINSNYFSMS